MAEVTPMKGKNGAQPPPSPPPPPAQEKRKPGRPPLGSPPIDHGPAFWKAVSNVPVADWEAGLACMYVYVTEPIVNLKVNGKNSHLVKLQKPIFDLQPLMEDYGSFQGYITLNRRKIQDALGPQLARLDFTIWNPKYPPKFPKEAWLNDDRNAKWKALLPEDQRQPPSKQAAPPPSQAPQEVAASMLNTLMDIQDRVEERLERNEPAAPPDPVEQMRGISAVIKDLKGDSGMGDVLKVLLAQSAAAAQMAQAQINAAAAQIAAEREANRDFQKLLFTERTKPAEVDPLRKKLEERMVEDLFDRDNGPAAGRSKMNAWMEFLQPLVGGIAPGLNKLMEGFSIFMVAGAQQKAHEAAMRAHQQHATAQPPTTATATQPPTPTAVAPLPPPIQAQSPTTEGTQSPMPMHMPLRFTPEQMVPFIDQIIEPLRQHVEAEKDGWDLAQWLIDGRGMTAYSLVRDQGVDSIMQAFRLSEYWPALQSKEAQLKEFVEQFCTWPPPEDDDDEDEEEDEPEPQTEVI